MFTKTRNSILVLLALLLVIAFAVPSLPDQASAAKPLDTASNSCLTCHEDRYYLHDMGKEYCISDQADHCVNCHEGNAEVMKMEESHLGMIAHPQQNAGEKCQECHPGDVEERLAAYETEGGFKDVVYAEPYAAASEVSDQYPLTDKSNTITENLPVLAVALLLFGLWLVLVFSSPQKP